MGAGGIRRKNEKLIFAPAKSSDTPRRAVGDVPRMATVGIGIVQAARSLPCKRCRSPQRIHTSRGHCPSTTSTRSRSPLWPGHIAKRSTPIPPLRLSKESFHVDSYGLGSGWSGDRCFGFWLLLWHVVQPLLSLRPGSFALLDRQLLTQLLPPRRWWWWPVLPGSRRFRDELRRHADRRFDTAFRLPHDGHGSHAAPAELELHKSQLCTCENPEDFPILAAPETWLESSATPKTRFQRAEPCTNRLRSS